MAMIGATVLALLQVGLGRMVGSLPNLLAALAAFGAMIFFHELGHFLMAKRARVRVHAFAVGFGPRLYGWERGGTAYTLNLLPFGGYVRMEGEDDQGGGALGPESFRAKSVGARLSIIAAGPGMNLVLAVLILALAAATGGVPTGPGTRIATIEPGWPAEQAGLRPGDEIVAIDGTRAPRGEQIIEIINRSAGRPLVLTVRRDGRELTVTVTPRLDPARNVGRIGFSPEQVFERQGPIRAVWWGLESTGAFIAGLFSIIGTLISQGQFLRELGGPVMAGNALFQAAGSGLLYFLHIAAYLSVVIGVFNLFPVPALDGGRIAFLLGEALLGRPVLDQRREGLIHMVGLVLLLGLIVVLTFRDIGRLVLGGGR
jgi:regulator of sigma E protease